EARALGTGRADRRDLAQRPLRRRRRSRGRPHRRVNAGPGTLAQTAEARTLSRKPSVSGSSALRRTPPDSLGVSGFAVAERPVGLVDLHQVDEDVLASDAEAIVQAIGHGGVEGALLVDAAPRVEGDLNDEAVVGPGDVEIGAVDREVLGGVLGDDLEAVVSRH